MLTDRELRSEFVTALEAVTPPAPWLLESIERAATQQVRRRRRITFGFRVSLRLVAAAVLIALILSGTAVFLAIHHAATNVVPAGHGYSLATARSDWGMVTATAGWEETNSIDASTGWHQILRTTDGGSHWKDVTPPPSVISGTSQHSYHQFILDADHAWVGADPSVDVPAPQGIVVFRTEDGGKTWQRGSTLPWAGNSNGQLDFVDARHGWLLTDGPMAAQATSQPMLFATVDGGLKWTLVLSHLVGPASACDLTSIAFASQATGWASATCPQGPSSFAWLLVTRDGGTTWNDQETPLSLTSFSVPPVVFDKDHALLVSDLGPVARQVLMTSDAGNNWRELSLPGDVQLLVDFIDAKHGWTVAGPSSWFLKTANGLPSVPRIVLPLYHTDDGGLTWSRVRTTELIESSQGRVADLYFVDQRNGFLERVNATTQQTFLFRTTDGGQTWALVGGRPPR